MSSEASQAHIELLAWQQKMQRPPSFLNNFARRVQVRLNAFLPERVHKAITGAIKQMVRGVLFGSKHTTSKPLADASLTKRETEVRARIRDYRTIATAEGAVTGAGGFLLGLASSPLAASTPATKPTAAWPTGTPTASACPSTPTSSTGAPSSRNTATT